jgi:hypothetical protein
LCQGFRRAFFVSDGIQGPVTRDLSGQVSFLFLPEFTVCYQKDDLLCHACDKF